MIQWQLIHLFIVCLTTTLYAYIPAGYVGCYKDRRSRTLDGPSRKSDGNTGDDCKDFCSYRGFRYAGTESREECFCGDVIRRHDLDADGCNYKCPGNHEEICGGHWRISVYDTWQCATIPCRNNAKCVDFDAYNFNCECSGEWTGKHCDEAKTTTTTTQTTSTTTTTSSSTSSLIATTTTATSTVKTSSSVVTKARTGKIVSPHVSTTKTNAINVTSFPQTITDNSGDAMIAMFVLLPVVVIVLFTVAALLYLRRRRRNKEAVPEVIYQGTGSLPNLAVPSGDQLRCAPRLTRDLPATRNAELDSKDTTAAIGHGMEETTYNSVNLRTNINHGQNSSLYDHTTMFQESCVEKTYSQLSAADLGKINKITQNTYSHFENFPGQIEASGNIENDDVTYNRLEMKGSSNQDLPIHINTADISDYDHTAGETILEPCSETVDYLNINDVASNLGTVQNDNSECSLSPQHEYVGEDEYAIVVKKPMN